MAELERHQALVPASQKILHLISQVVGIHQRSICANKFQLLEPMG